MSFNLSTFRRLVPSFARNQYFIVRIPQIGNEEIVTALAKSTSIPARTNEVTNVHYRGIPMKVMTKPTFASWPVTFICDEAHTVRNLFLKWSEYEYNVQNLQNFSHNKYKVDGLSVSQLAADGSVSSTTTFYGAFPSIIGEIAVSQEGGVIEECAVTFEYDYNVLNSLTGDVVFNDVDIDVDQNGRFKGATVQGVAGLTLRL